MPLPDSGKIAIGVVGALGAIAVLHLAVFKGRADEFKGAKGNYDGILSQYQALGNAQPLKEVYGYKFQTLWYTKEYWDLMADLNITVPLHYFPGPDNNVNLQRKDFGDLLTDLQARAADTKAPRLSFLSNSTGWDIQSELPQALRQTGVIEDRIQRLRNSDRTLKVLDQRTDLYRTRLNEYTELLRTLGMDLSRRDAIRTTYGDLAALMYSLNRIKLVRTALGDGFFKDMTEDAASEMMFQLFRVEWPSDPDPLYGMYPYYRQAQNLKLIMNLTEQAALQDVTVLRLWEPRAVWFDPNRPEPGVPGKATPTPKADRRFNDEDGNPTNPDEDFGEPDTKGKEKSSVALPFQIQYGGTNLQSVTFLDLCARSRVPLEVDAITIQGLPNTEGLQLVTAIVNSVGYIPFVLVTEDMIARGKVDAIRSLSEVAQKAGAREVAIEKGFLNADGTFAMTIPTPFPTPVPQ